MHEDRLDPQLRRDINRTTGIIADTLGVFNDFFSDLPKRIRVTAGATATRSRRESLPYLKMRFRRLPASDSAIPYLRALGTYYGFNKVTFKVTNYNRVQTVPKNWETDRTIACEPEGNLVLQLALDSYIKECLHSLGVNLSDQFRNQRLAKEGSINDDLVTLDLSMASDTAAYNAVAWLTPSPWFKYAADIRVQEGHGFGRTFKYNKFSSMGNGATFTLETLIFAAFCKASGATRMAVYGDDLIVNKECLPRLYALLKFFGFQLNRNKSFTSGPFRESCGTDWFNGRDVTPFYLRSGGKLKSELCHNINGLASIATLGGKLHEYLRNLIIEERLPFVPFNESSISGVWIDSHEAYSQRIIRSEKHTSSLRFKAYVPKTKNRDIRTFSTYFLWHLDAARRNDVLVDERFPIHLRPIVGENCIIRSSVPIFSHKYVRKWVYWLPPVVATPVHLYWWTDFITAVRPR
jgi:hypothetical protein